MRALVTRVRDKIDYNIGHNRKRRFNPDDVTLVACAVGDVCKSGVPESMRVPAEVLTINHVGWIERNGFDVYLPIQA